MKVACRPVGKNAPPRPRRFDWISSSVTSCGAIARAFSSWAYPPTARYEARSRSGRSIAPPNTRGVPSAPIVVSAIPQLLHDRRDVGGGHRLAVAVVDGDDRRRRAAAQAFDRPQRHLSLLGRLSWLDPALVPKSLEHGPPVHAAAPRVGPALNGVH